MKNSIYKISIYRDSVKDCIAKFRFRIRVGNLIIIGTIISLPLA